MKSLFITLFILICFISLGIFIGQKLLTDRDPAALTDAIEKDPLNAEAYYERGSVRYLNGDYNLAVDDLVKAVELDPDYALAYNDLSWILATCPDEKYRDGKEAIQLAQKALEIRMEPAFMDTFAAAYAEAGKFEEAIATQEKAISMLNKTWFMKIISRNEYVERLNAYKAHRPWRSAD